MIIQNKIPKKPSLNRLLPAKEDEKYFQLSFCSCVRSHRQTVSVVNESVLHTSKLVKRVGVVAAA